MSCFEKSGARALKALRRHPGVRIFRYLEILDDVVNALSIDKHQLCFPQFCNVLISTVEDSGHDKSPFLFEENILSDRVGFGVKTRALISWPLS